VDQNQQTRHRKQARFSLSQETITIVTVGVALAGLIVMQMGQMRAETRADRARAEAAMNQMRAEGRANREEMRSEARADREAFANQITRLVEQQGTLNGLVDGLRHAIPSPED